MRAWIASLFVIAACSGKARQPTGPGPTPASGTIATGSPAPPPSPTPVSGPPPVAPEPALPGVKVSLADVGLEAASIDRSADACVDFYQLACGGWLQNNPIPADRARWARFAELDEKNKAALKTILEDAAKEGADPSTKQLGDAYASCMDEATIEKAGLAPLAPLLDRVKGVKDARTWMTAVIELHRLGEWVVWSAAAGPDYKDSRMNVTNLDSAGLGLPDRDYYVKPELADKVEAYRTHVGKMLALAGTPAAKLDAAVADVLAIESELAKLTKTGVERRDVSAMYNAVDLEGLAKLAASVDWPAYFKAVGYAPSKQLVVTSPKYFAGIAGLRQKFKPARWASYFTYHAVHRLAFALPKAFDDEAFELQRALTGVEQQRDRAKRCIDTTTAQLGELLGQLYVAKHFSPASKQTAADMIDAIMKVMAAQITKLEWMSEGTRTIAQAKLAKIVKMVGYPDRWKTYGFEIRRADFAGNLLRAKAFETRRDLARSGKPVDRGEWQMSSFTVNAYYEPTMNNTALPAGILQPPFFGQDRQIAANLGGIGMVIGHELTHGFDDQGAQFDADGNLKNWWQAEDKAKFDAKATCVADQYSTFEARPKQFVNGRLTLGENIADLGGVKMAFAAYRALRAGAAKVYLADGFTEDQQFFLAVGQAWCSKDRPAEIQRRLTVDVHAPPRFRVYGALRNLPEFATAFKCAPGTPMRPASSCSVW